MSLKQELETWAGALKAYEEDDFDKALELFSRIAESSKILTNMALIYATLGEHELAVEQFNAAVGLDRYLAVAYFQCGVSNFLLGRYELSLKDFDEAELYLRGNEAINYEQLGLKFRLYSAEVLFNKGLTLIYMGQRDNGMRVLEAARKEKRTPEHEVIDEAIRERAEGYTVFSIPVGVLYRPSENKLRNAKTKDYLGKAKLVAASDASDVYTTFSGSTRLKQGLTPFNTRVDTSAATISGLPTPPASSSSPSRPNSDPNLDERPLTKPRQGGGSLRAPASSVGGRAGPGRFRDEGYGSRSSVARSDPLPSAVPGIGSIRRQRANTPPGQDSEQQGPPPPAKSNREPDTGPRLTEIYDDYYNVPAKETAPQLPPLPGQTQDNNRIQAWARGANNAPPPSSFNAVRSRTTSNYEGSRRGSTRRRAPGGGSVSRNGRYEDEDERGSFNGSGSGDFDDGYTYSGTGAEMRRIRVKIFYKNDIRGMALNPNVAYEDFLEKLCQKFEVGFGQLGVQFKDEDGHNVSIRDESDFDMAIETAREGAKGSEGKLEVFCDDL